MFKWPVKSIHCLIAVVFLHLTTTNSTKISNWTTCDGRHAKNCNCISDVFTNVTARCYFNHLTELRMIINVPQDLYRLNLSGNNIKKIPYNSFFDYQQLRYLSLSSNKIQDISRRAFAGLTRLRELNLQDNMIRQWDTTLIHQDLPNLIMLNVAQNIYWKPDQQILLLPNLKIVYLLSEVYDFPIWIRCHLVQSNETVILDVNTIIEKVPRNYKEKVEAYAAVIMADHCISTRLQFLDENYWSLIDKAKYYFHCKKHLKPILVKNVSKKASSVLHRGKPWFYFIRVPTRKCWSVLNSILWVPLIEGITAMVFNLIVVITTVRSRVLRESVAHVLVANIAVGDLLVSLYMIIMTSTRQMMDPVEYDDFYLPYYCRFVGLLFLNGQYSSPMMSFIMTLERYLAVVYCMKPHIRITKRMAYGTMVVVWSLFTSFSVSFMTSKQFSLKTTDECVPLGNIDGLQLSYFFGGIGILLYVLSMALYGHMYLDFHKTNQKTVQLQRENRLARRIVLIMFTNVLFFILPLLIIALIQNIVNLSNFDYKVFLSTFIFSCLGMNSCLNPILFSFRNETFRREFRRHFFRCKNTVAAED